MEMRRTKYMTNYTDNVAGAGKKDERRPATILYMLAPTIALARSACRSALWEM